MSLSRVVASVVSFCSRPAPVQAPKFFENLESRQLLSGTAAAVQYSPATPANLIPGISASAESEPKAALSSSTSSKSAYKAKTSYFDGVSVSGDNPTKVIPVLRSLHLKSVRLWLGMKSWSHRSSREQAIDYAGQYKRAGFKVMMNVGAPQVPSYSQAVNFFNWMKNLPGAKKNVDLWEIGNEPNQKSFWKGSASQYVNNVLKAAWSVLHPAGMKVVGAGATWDVNFAKTLARAGYTKYVDFANFHTYGPSPQEVYNRAKGARAAFSGKPIIFSEWNVRGASSTSQWARELDQARKMIAPLADIAFYFPLTVGSTMAGPGGLVTKSYKPRQPFFNTVENWN
jgi:hypothetical protein